MNPQHTVPTMEDGELVLNESRPIATYLVAKYGKCDKLYPADIVTRAVIDQRLYFDMGVFYKSLGDVVVSIRYLDKKGIFEIYLFLISLIPKNSNGMLKS